MSDRTWRPGSPPPAAGGNWVTWPGCGCVAPTGRERRLYGSAMLKWMLTKERNESAPVLNSNVDESRCESIQTFPRRWRVYRALVWTFSVSNKPEVVKGDIARGFSFFCRATLCFCGYAITRNGAAANLFIQSVSALGDKGRNVCWPRRSSRNSAASQKDAQWKWDRRIDGQIPYQCNTLTAMEAATEDSDWWFPIYSILRLNYAFSCIYTLK